jgi:DNA replication and repair protein RecF
MRAAHLVARGFRNLADLELDLPPGGGAFLGPNGHGKTNVLEALYYPVLFRSFRAATDPDVCRWDGPGFQVEVEADGPSGRSELVASFARGGRKKRITVDGVDTPRLTDAVGHWLAVVFLPTDLHLVQGPAAGRRQYLDRVLSLSDVAYLRALLRYRAVVAQRNAALRAGRDDMVLAFSAGLAEPGALVVRHRLQWVASAAARFVEECDALGETMPVSLEYRGNRDLADAEAWAPTLTVAAARERARGMSLVGPQRDDVVLTLSGRPLREFGSTGQQRTAAIALKLCELATIGTAHRTEPALLLDDVFAELDRDRQERLAARLGGPGVRQVFVTAPRRDELPATLALDLYDVRDGRVTPAGS